MATVDASAQVVRQPAFVLHARPWRETSLMVEVLSAHDGRLGVVARGLSSPRQHALRAALQPWQWIALSYVPRGELCQLRGAEALDTAPRLSGAAVLPGFYVNELLLRLAPRQDPLPGLYRAYAEVRQQLGEGLQLAWALRRFERDLLAQIGLGLDWRCDIDGHALQAQARYLIDPEQGLRPVRADVRLPTASGAALLALAADRCPDRMDLASLRLPLRGLLAHHLGARGLQSWQLAASLERSSQA